MDNKIFTSKPRSMVTVLVRCYDIGSLIAFLAMMGCIMIEVFCRNIIHMPTTWAEEASRFFCVWTVFLGSASAWYRGSHIIIHVLISRLAGRIKLIFQIVIELLTAIFLVSIWFGGLLIMKINYPVKTTALEVSITYFYLGLFLGVTGIIVFHFNAMGETIRQLKGLTAPSGERG